MSALDPTSDRPLAAQLADLIREEIKSGARRPGSKLPSESEFHELYGLSRTTVRGSLAVLSREGLIVTRKGYGSYVQERKPVHRIVRGHDHDRSGTSILNASVETSGHRVGQRMLLVDRIPVLDDVREHLNLPADVEQIAVRQQLQLIDDEPMVISTSYYPLWYAAGTALEHQDALPQGPDAVIAALGYTFGSVHRIHSARMPDSKEARLLRIGPGVPLFRCLLIDYSDEDQPLTMSDDLYRSDCFEFVDEDS